MDAQSQITKSGQYSRVCNSCRRNLNLCHFGSLWNGRNGFNSTCKTCRKQSQKKHFAKSYKRKSPFRAKPADFIAALDAHNYGVLSEALSRGRVAELTGISTLNGSPCRAIVQVIELGPTQGLRLQLFVQNDDRPLTVESGAYNIEHFTRYCVLILREQSVRLYGNDWLSRSESIFLSELVPANP